MRQKVVGFLGMVLLAGVIAGPFVYASGTVDTALGQQEQVTRDNESTTEVGVRSTQPAILTNSESASVATPDPVLEAEGLLYVAMGDSVAAGAGLPNDMSATGMDELCDRSSQAYSYLIAQRLQTSVVHTACSGAKVDEGIYGNQDRSNTIVPPQINAAFASGAPDIITVTIGANDVRWNQFIRQCYVTRCGFAVDDARMKLYRADLRIELTRMLAQIQANSRGAPPQVFISGYYSPIATTECLSGERITATEATWLSEQAANLNQAIRSVVPLFSFTEYVPIDFTGHEVCSGDPWVQGLEAEAPIHPTAAGQAVIAESFLKAMGQ